MDCETSKEEVDLLARSSKKIKRAGGTEGSGDGIEIRESWRSKSQVFVQGHHCGISRCSYGKW